MMHADETRDFVRFGKPAETHKPAALYDEGTGDDGTDFTSFGHLAETCNPANFVRFGKPAETHKSAAPAGVAT